MLKQAALNTNTLPGTIFQGIYPMTGTDFEIYQASMQNLRNFQTKISLISQGVAPLAIESMLFWQNLEAISNFSLQESLGSTAIVRFLPTRAFGHEFVRFKEKPFANFRSKFGIVKEKKEEIKQQIAQIKEAIEQVSGEKQKKELVAKKQAKEEEKQELLDWVVNYYSPLREMKGLTQLTPEEEQQKQKRLETLNQEISQIDAQIEELNPYKILPELINQETQISSQIETLKQSGKTEQDPEIQTLNQRLTEVREKRQKLMPDLMPDIVMRELVKMGVDKLSPEEAPEFISRALVRLQEKMNKLEEEANRLATVERISLICSFIPIFGGIMDALGDISRGEDPYKLTGGIERVYLHPQINYRGFSPEDERLSLIKKVLCDYIDNYPTLTDKEKKQRTSEINQSTSLGLSLTLEPYLLGRRQDMRVVGNPPVVSIELNGLLSKINESGGLSMLISETKKQDEKLDELRKNYPWLKPLIDLSTDEKVKQTLKLLSKGISLYAPLQLLQRTEVDRFGRPTVTEYYGAEWKGESGRWQPYKLDKITQHYWGPFGQTMSITKDYSEIKAPWEWPMKTEIVQEKIPAVYKEVTEPVYEWVTVKKVNKKKVNKKVESQPEERKKESEPPQIPLLKFERLYPVCDDTYVTGTGPQIPEGGELVTEGLYRMPKQNSAAQQETPPAQEETASAQEKTASAQEKTASAQEETRVRQKVGETTRRVLVSPETTITREIKTPLPLSLGGPNLYYDLNVYDTGPGQTPFAGPIGAINTYSIKSGPLLQAGANYIVNPDLLAAQREAAQQAFVAELEEKITGTKPKGLKEVPSLIAKKIKDLAGELGDILRFSWNEFWKEFKINHPDIDDSNSSPVFNEWIKRVLGELKVKDKDAFEKLDAEKLNQYLTSEFSEIQGVTTLQNIRLEDRVQTLPTWSQKIGIGDEGNLRFLENQNYIYYSPLLLSKLREQIKTEEEKEEKGDWLMAERLRSSSVYNLRGFALVKEANEPLLLPAYSYTQQMFYPSEFKILERLGNYDEGMGTDPSYPVQDVDFRRLKEEKVSVATPTSFEINKYIDKPHQRIIFSYQGNWYNAYGEKISPPKSAKGLELIPSKNMSKKETETLTIPLFLSNQYKNPEDNSFLDNN